MGVYDKLGDLTETYSPGSGGQKSGIKVSAGLHTVQGLKEPLSCSWWPQVTASPQSLFLPSCGFPLCLCVSFLFLSI